MEFVQGHTYVAGFDKPLIVSLDTIERGVEREGFRVLGVFDCENIPGFPFEVEGQCGEQWDHIAVVERTGPTQFIDVPDRVSWIVDTAPEPPPPGAKLVHKRQQQIDLRRAVHIGAELAGLLVVAPLTYWASTKMKKGPARTAVAGAAIGTAVVDAALLASYALD